MHYISIFEDITESTLPRIVKELRNVDDGSEVTIQICSAGGLVFNAFGIIDYMKIHNFKTTAEVLGYAASAAALVALSCDHVKMASYTSLMLHSAYPAHPQNDEVDEGVERANAVQLQIIKKRCPDFDEKSLDEDTWYSSDQAYNLGFVDEIITDTESMVAFCRTFLNSLSNKETLVMEKEIEKKEVIEEKEVAECGDKEVKAEEVSIDDVIEALAKRLDAHDSLLAEIAHRLAVLEGEGKKEEDMAEDMEAPEGDVLARRKALYAKLVKVAAPTPAPKAKASAKKSKINLTHFFD